MSLLDYRDEVDSVPGPTPMTEEEFLEVDGKAEWIEGVAYFMSPASLVHDDVRAWIHGVMRIVAKEKGLGTVHGESVAVRFVSRQMRCPDVAFVAAESVVRRERNRLVGAPEFLVEVVSPDSVERDYVEKLKLYEREGVREYLLVDVLKRAVFLYRLVDGKYVNVPAVEGKLVSEVVKGFYFRPQWLIGSTLPSEFRIVAEMGIE